MGDKTKIEWTRGDDGRPGASWNPIRARDLGPVGTGKGPAFHCEIVTPGCENCYSQAINRRLGTHRPYRRTERQHVSVYLDEIMLNQPLRWRRPRRIFVCSMTDLFGEWVPDQTIERVFGVMALCPQHIFQVLTKRAERMRDYLRRYTPMEAHGVFPGRPGPLPNVWIGVSVEDQRRADERIPLLLQTPAAVRWISAEPLLEYISLRRLSIHGGWYDSLAGYRDVREGPVPEETLDWIVVGGESGVGARPFNIEWGYSIIRQCAAAGVSCFVKQLGSYPYNWPGNQECALISENRIRLRDRKGGDPGEWPEDLRVREWPEKINA